MPTLVVPVEALRGPAIVESASAVAPHAEAEPDALDVGDVVEIESNGTWLPATLVEQRGDRWLVLYLATTGDRIPEVVERERIRLTKGLGDGGDGDLELP